MNAGVTHRSVTGRAGSGPSDSAKRVRHHVRDGAAVALLSLFASTGFAIALRFLARLSG